ncbi:MAG: prenyltransferase/squalene oxidase repeat-containing protein [Tepidisphaeraceae bacterium]
MQQAFKCVLLCVVAVGLWGAGNALAADGTAAAEKGQAVVDKAVAFLKTQQQKDGSWQKTDREPPAIAAMALRILMQDPKEGPATPEAKKAVAYLLTTQKDDGGFYRMMLANYNTAIIVSVLAKLDDPAVKAPVAKGVAFLKANQWTEETQTGNGQKAGADSPFVGGWDYGGGRGRPDLSNTAMVLEALNDAGLKKDDPTYQRALKFVMRMQNRSESNPAEWAGNDGGFIYSAGRNGEGNSSAGEYKTAEGKRALRSYGSMTYAGLKSMIHAGLTKDDPRVQSAWQWISGNWTLEENPGMSGMGQDAARAGIFYYYNTLGRSLSAYGQTTVTDSKKAAHDWRVELIDKVAASQKLDGSFAGDPRWMEDNPVIATTLAVLAVQDAIRDLQERPTK